MASVRGRRLLGLLFLTLLPIGTIVYFEDVKKTTINIREIYCPTDNIVTVKQGGRFGNCVWEYVSALAVGEALGYATYVPRGIYDSLNKVFKNLRIPAYEETLLSETCRKIHGGDVGKCMYKSLSKNGTAWDRLCYDIKNGNAISKAIASKPVSELKEMKPLKKLPTILIMPTWLDLPHIFDTVGIERFRKEFQFRDEIEQLAMRTLNGVKKKFNNSELTYVGVHVRRTDYANHMKIIHGEKVALADVDYYSRAMRRMHELYNGSKLVFTVLSDDYAWCKENLLNETEGVFWGGLQRSAFIDNWEETEDMSTGHDLAVLSMQNHTIIGYGTFAITGSLLSGGHTIVCNISRNANVRNSFSSDLENKLSNWEQL